MFKNIIDYLYNLVLGAEQKAEPAVVTQPVEPIMQAIQNQVWSDVDKETLETTDVHTVLTKKAPTLH